LVRAGRRERAVNGGVSGATTDGWVLAIDFGTTNTTAAMVAVGASEASVLEIENSRYLPSVVFRDEAGQLLTGRAAVGQSMVFPERAERVPKRALVAGGQVILGGVAVPVTDPVAALLRRVHTEAIRFHGGRPPAQVVLTHPARWGEPLLERLRQAAHAAGITNLDTVPEPVAAAWWYARPSSGAVAAIFDLGGGTLDIAVLRADRQDYAVAGQPGGNAELGGEDFDDLLLARISGMALSRNAGEWAAVFDGKSARSRRDLALVRADVTTAKENLSEHLSYDLGVVGFSDAFRITRPELEDLIGPLLDEAVTEMRRTISAAGISPDQLTGLFLTGGSSRIPLIAARLADKLGIRPQLRDDPKTVVALGALAAVNAVPAPPGHADEAEALVREGDRLAAESRPAEAESAYRMAIDSGDRAAAAHAQYRLGVLLSGRGNVNGAYGALQAASDSGDAEWAPTAASSLGMLLQQHGDVAGAKRAHERAVASGNIKAAAHSAYRLGWIFQEEGDVAAMRRAFERAMDLGDSDWSPLAAFALGKLLQELGKKGKARAAYQRAADFNHPDVSPGAGLHLGRLLWQIEDKDEAAAAFRRVISSGHADHASEAAVSLGLLLEEIGDIGGARAAFQQAIDSRHVNNAPQAANNLGTLLQRQGDLAGARAAFERALGYGGPEHTPMALINLGCLFLELRDFANAKSVLERAITTGHHYFAPNAILQLGYVFKAEGNRAEARRYFQRAVSSGQPYAAGKAAAELR
jgi:tetratricopeptide (TPR) repeat protein